MTERPNVLLVMCDQLRYDVFSHMGHTGISTPHLDQFAAEGVVFTDATCSSPLCGPSRAAMLTGCYSYDGKYVPQNREPAAHSLIRKPVVTSDQALAGAGYHTEYHGKWHTGNSHRECYRGDRDVFGHDLYSYHRYLAERHAWPSDSSQRMESYSFWPYEPWEVDSLLCADAAREFNIYHQFHWGVMDVPDNDTLTAFTVQKTIDFLKSGPSEPFAVTCSILHPHLPFTPNRKYAGMFDPLTVPLPANVHAHYYAPLTLHPDKKKPIPELLGEDGSGLGQCVALYLALVKEVDDWFGRLLGALEDSGHKDDTLVIFTSDHGDLGGSHNMFSKFQFYEESVRVPLYLRLPGRIPTGERLDVPANGVDLAPTILDYCGLDALPQFHGQSLRPIVEGGDSPSPWAYSEIWGHHGFRSNEWMVAFNRERDPVMVFDLREDPGQFNNLIEDESGIDVERADAVVRSVVAETTHLLPKP